MSLVPDKIYSSKGATADLFGVSDLILELADFFFCKVHTSYFNVVMLRMYYGSSKLLTIV